MSAMVLSASVALVVVAMALWAVVTANRAAPPDNLAPGRYPGVDMDTFMTAWSRKIRLKDRRPADIQEDS